MAAAAFILLGGNLSPSLAQDTDAVVLEVPPGELGVYRAEGMVAMAPFEDGEKLIFMVQQTGTVDIFEESGDRFREALELRDERFRPFSQKSPSFMAVEGNVVALVGMRNSYLFDLRIGETKAHRSNLPFSADVEATKFGWAVGLQNMPMGAAKIYGRGQFEDDIPRVVLLDDELEIKRTGLIEEELPQSGSIGAARRLKLAWDGDSRLYAAELANYRIYALDKDLDLRATYSDPELILEEGLDLQRDEEKSKIEGQLVAAAEKQGQDLTRTGADKERVLVAEAFDYQAVIKGIDWDRRQNRLLVLLAKGIAGDSAALDIINPALGEVRRVGLAFPSGVEPQSFGQVVAGHDYIWFRNYNGKNPIYRLDREQLRDKGELLTLPEVSLFDTDDPE